IQGPQVHFDFVCGASENGRAATWAEKPPGIVACFAVDRDCILGENGRGVKQSPMMLAAVETVTKADTVRSSRRHNPDVAAQAPPPVNRSMLRLLQDRAVRGPRAGPVPHALPWRRRMRPVLFPGPRLRGHLGGPDMGPDAFPGIALRGHQANAELLVIAIAIGK